MRQEWQQQETNGGRWGWRGSLAHSGHATMFPLPPGDRTAAAMGSFLSQRDWPCRASFLDVDPWRMLSAECLKAPRWCQTTFILSHCVFSLSLTRNVYCGWIHRCGWSWGGGRRWRRGLAQLWETRGALPGCAQYLSSPLKWAGLRLNLLISGLVHFNLLILYFSQIPSFPLRVGIS